MSGQLTARAARIFAARDRILAEIGELDELEQAVALQYAVASYADHLFKTRKVPHRETASFFVHMVMDTLRNPAGLVVPMPPKGA